MKKPSQNKKNKKLIVSAVAILALLIVAGLTYFLMRDRKTQPVTDSTTVSEETPVAVVPATPEEKQEAEDNKTQLINENSSHSDDGSTIKPVITSASQLGDQVEVGSRVPGVFESSGTCTLTLTKGTQSVTASQNAEQNVSEMSCGFITIPVSKLSDGRWQATVTYKSEAVNGTSDPVSVEVQ